jgi:hypothetical protein
MINPTASTQIQHRQVLHRDAVELIASTPIRDPRGGLTTVAAASADMQDLRHAVLGETRAGSRRHLRISRTQRLVVRLLPALDWVVLVWFLTGVLNVDLRVVDPALLVAVALALLCTIAVAAWTSAVGEHIQRSKDDRGDVVWQHLDTTSWALLAITLVMSALLGVLMYVRVADEVYQATGVADATGVAIALALAASVVLLNTYVLYLSFRDGSVATRDLDRLGRAVAPHVRRQHRAHGRARAAARRADVRSMAEQRVRRAPEQLPTPTSSPG